MLSIRHYPTFILSVLIFQMIHGPGTITIHGTNAQEGRRAGMSSMAGTLAGDLVFRFAALAKVAQHHAGLFLLLQYAGALFPIWTGMDLLRTNHVLFRSAHRPPGRNRTRCCQGIRGGCNQSEDHSFFPCCSARGASYRSLVVPAPHVSLQSLLYQVVLTGEVIVRRLAHRPHLRQIVGWVVWFGGLLYPPGCRSR